jgi:hypothetical protein
MASELQTLVSRFVLKDANVRAAGKRSPAARSESSWGSRVA